MKQFLDHKCIHSLILTFVILAIYHCWKKNVRLHLTPNAVCRSPELWHESSLAPVYINAIWETAWDFEFAAIFNRLLHLIQL